jgi:hypothetical protein
VVDIPVPTSWASSQPARIPTDSQNIWLTDGPRSGALIASMVRLGDIHAEKDAIRSYGNMLVER